MMTPRGDESRRRRNIQSSLSTAKTRSGVIVVSGRVVGCMFALLFMALVAVQVYFLHSSSSSSHHAPHWPDSSRSGGKSLSFDQAKVKQGDYLPAWLLNYIDWHGQMRKKFPGKELFDHPDAPPVLIRTCLGLCGGLNDRLGQLAWDLYLANQTGRVLLMHWHRPVPLENFLVPPVENARYFVDWRVPPTMPGFFPIQGPRVTRKDMHIVRNYPELFDGFLADRPNATFWDIQFNVAMERATQGPFSKHHVLRHRLLGHINEELLEQRLKEAGETLVDLHRPPYFGRIFRLFFRPSDDVQEALDKVMREELHMNMTSSSAAASSSENPSLLPYSAVHCRVRHPKAAAGNVKGKNEKYPADRSGLPWEGETRAFAIATALRALQCARTLTNDPLYFFADSNDLVQYMAHDVVDPTFVQAHASLFESSLIDQTILKWVQEQRPLSSSSPSLSISSLPNHGVMARNVTVENAHIDKQKGRPAEAYYGTFIDLYLAMQARCVIFGIGYYAVLATKISGTTCTLLYQAEAWGKDENKTEKLRTNLCTLPDLSEPDEQ